MPGVGASGMSAITGGAGASPTRPSTPALISAYSFLLGMVCLFLELLFDKPFDFALGHEFHRIPQVDILFENLDIFFACVELYFADEMLHGFFHAKHVDFDFFDFVVDEVDFCSGFFPLLNHVLVDDENAVA